MFEFFFKEFKLERDLILRQIIYFFFVLALQGILIGVRYLVSGFFGDWEGVC